MAASPFTPSLDSGDFDSDINWNKLYMSLRPFARYLVYSIHLATWHGQENDVIDDIVQETARRLLERVRKARRGEAEPVHSPKEMMMTIAQNYCRDLRRSERKVSRWMPQFSTPEAGIAGQVQAHPLDEATEQVYHEEIFKVIAHEIANFPEKQRQAVLIDLANRMCFERGLTSLQKAFFKEGIELKCYQQPLPTDSRERSQHQALLNHAYKRVAHLPCIQHYIMDTTQTGVMHAAKNSQIPKC